MRARIAQKAGIFWALSYLALAGVIGTELDWEQPANLAAEMPPATSAAHVDYAIPPEFFLAPLGQGYAETTARPAFSPGRRAAAPLQPKPAMRKGQFILLGALITKEKSIALLREVATGKASRVEQGKEINGITVTSVLPEKVVLTQQGDSEEVVLKVQPMANPAAMTRTAPAQPPAPFMPQPGAPQSTAPQAATPPGGAPATAGTPDPNSLLNKRRAIRGLPPV